MQGYRHVLVAASYSGGDAPVFRRARQLAEQYQAQLSMVHVLDDIPLPDTEYGTVISLDQAMPTEPLSSVKHKMLQIAAELQIDAQNSWLVWGNPKQEIDILAKTIEADLIVVGSHGRHGLALLLGSTANSVLHHAQCDVLAVRLQDN